MMLLKVEIKVLVRAATCCNLVGSPSVAARIECARIWRARCTFGSVSATGFYR
jgi:hypothetical protein